MVRALGHSSLVVIIALTLLPSMPTLPIYAASAQSVQYSHLGKKEERKGTGKISNKQFKSIVNPAINRQLHLVIPNILFLDPFITYAIPVPKWTSMDRMRLHRYFQCNSKV